MSDGKRPGGLTALAVLNFVFGGFGLLGLLGLAMDPKIAQEVQKQGVPLLALVVLGLAAYGLMIASGVGYLGEKRFLGRTLGNAYAVSDLARSALLVVAMGIGIASIMGLVYPLFTLALINTTFKEDLVN